MNLTVSRYMQVVTKSRAACLAAVETFNRASALYREETFAILMINAWELLLKARVMQENGGKVSSIYTYRPRVKKDGTPGKRTEIKRSRSGSPLTIGLDRCIGLVSTYKTKNIDQQCVANIEALLEIRDTATHFISENAALNKTLDEICLASVRNYVLSAQDWFGTNFSDLNIATVPISFSLDQKDVLSVAKSNPKQVTDFLKFIKKLENDAAPSNSDNAVRIRVDFDLIKNKGSGAVNANVIKDPADLTVALEADKVPSGFVWTYKELIEKSKDRYIDFKQNGEFYEILKSVKSDNKLHYVRYLDPDKKKGSAKSFFNPNVVKVLDDNYTKRGATLFEEEPDNS